MSRGQTAEVQEVLGRIFVVFVEANGRANEASTAYSFIVPAALVKIGNKLFVPKLNFVEKFWKLPAALFIICYARAAFEAVQSCLNCDLPQSHFQIFTDLNVFVAGPGAITTSSPK